MRVTARVNYAVGLGLSLFALVVHPATASAQSESGAIVSAIASATVFENGASAAVSGTVGYRLNRAIGFGIELTYVPRLVSSPLSSPLATAFPIFRVESARGNAVFFTTNVRLEIPTTSARVLPFVVAGGGLASISQSYVAIFDYDPAILTFGGVDPGVFGFGGFGDLAEILPSIYPPVSSTSTTLALALTLGGGVSLLVNDHLSVDVDLRSFHLRGSNSGQVGRFGAGVSYRF